jgi:hypothetical protein
VAAEPGWIHRRSLHQVAEIPGVVSIAIVDRTDSAVVWSVAVEAGADAHLDADDLLKVVGAADRLGVWDELILISSDHYHLVQPFGVAERDDLVVELVLDMRTANLAAARQQLRLMLEPYRSAPGQPPEGVAPLTTSGLARRETAGPRASGAVQSGPSATILQRLLGGLRRSE